MLKRTKFELSVDLAIFLSLAFLSSIFPYFGFDLYFTKLLQQVELPWFGGLMTFLSYVGEPTRFPIIVFLSALLLFLVKKRKESLFLTLSFLGGTFLVEVFKLLVHRVRPNPLIIHQYLPEKLPDSFPSGHVMFYLTFFGFLIFLSRGIRSGLVRILVSLIGIGLIILIGLSRIYLGEHWLSDVLGSYLLGIAWLYFVIKIYLKQ